MFEQYNCSLTITDPQSLASVSSKPSWWYPTSMRAVRTALRVVVRWPLVSSLTTLCAIWPILKYLISGKRPPATTAPCSCMYEGHITQK